MSWAQRSDKVIAQGCGTYSKHRSQFIEGVYPTHCIGGGSGYIYVEEEGKKKHLIDFMGACGANLRGTQNSHSLPHIIEVEVAELLVERIQCIDKLKFLKTGSEACSAARRIAMGYTSKSEGVSLGYHGWHIPFMAEENLGIGYMQQDHYNCKDLKHLIHTLTDEPYNHLWAYCIIEPVQLSIGVQAELEEIRKICTEKGIILIFDEIITGFRVPHYTISNWWGIQPDLICLGKGLANGYPLAVVGGKKEIMDTPDYFISSTFSGEVASLANAKKNIVEITEKRLKGFWELGKWFRSSFNKISPHLQLNGYATRAQLEGEYKDMFMQQMLRKGYFFGKAWFLNMSHTKLVLEKCLEDAAESLTAIQRGIVRLEGKPSQEVFKRNG